MTNDVEQAGPLEEALPREMYVDAGHWAVERDAVLFGEWYCAGRVDDLGLAAPKQLVAVDVAGESVLVTSDEDGALHAAYNVCRHRGAQLCAPDLHPWAASMLAAARGIARGSNLAKTTWNPTSNPPAWEGTIQNTGQHSLMGVVDSATAQLVGLHAATILVDVLAGEG